MDWVACALSVFITWRMAEGGMLSLNSSTTCNQHTDRICVSTVGTSDKGPSEIETTSPLVVAPC